MKESDLYPPVHDWLISNGWEVHAEIFDADIVAFQDGKLMAVELKPCLTSGLWRQCFDRAGWADFVVAAVASNPRTTRQFIEQGFGVLLVVGGKIKQKHKPRPQPWRWHRRRDYRIKKLASRAPVMPHEIAGLPSCSQLRDQRLQRDGGGE